MAEVLFVGAGAVGAPIAAWLVDAGHRVTVLARGATAEALVRDGITWFVADPDGGTRHTARVSVVTSLAGLARPELVVIGVKSAALPVVSRELVAAFGRDLLVVGLQNGFEVLRQLPSAFPRATLAIVHFNGFPADEGARRVYGVQHRGALVVAPLGRTARADADRVAAILASATTIVRAPGGGRGAQDGAGARDAVLCKMVVNLSGSLQTLVALHERPADDPDALQALFSGLLGEGVRIIRAAGAREVKVPNTPSWLVIAAAARLPRRLTRPLFVRNVAKMRVSSLAQDVARGVRREETELDAIHGELVRLADAFGIEAPIARVVLEALVERLEARGSQGGRTGAFVPMQVSEVLARVGRAR